MLYKIAQVGGEKDGQNLYPPHGHRPVRGGPGSGQLHERYLHDNFALCVAPTGRLSVVVPHPFARKKANGWGTGLLCVNRRWLISGRDSLRRVKLHRTTVHSFNGLQRQNARAILNRSWGAREVLSNSGPFLRGLLIPGMPGRARSASKGNSASAGTRVAKRVSSE
jgi:hypothetical protein